MNRHLRVEEFTESATKNASCPLPFLSFISRTLARLPSSIKANTLNDGKEDTTLKMI